MPEFFMPTEMKLPELGENVESGDVLRVLVKAGDRVKKDQAVLELETDKATIEVPSSAEGVIKDIKVKAGDKVKVGQTILVVEDGAGQKPEGEGQRAEGKEQTASTEAGAPPKETPKTEPSPKEQAPVSPKPSEAAAKADSPPADKAASTRQAAPAAAPKPVPAPEPRRPAQVFEMTRPQAAPP